MARYERPRLIATYSIERLQAEAATCAAYGVPSDRALKDDIATVENPLSQLGAIRRA